MSDYTNKYTSAIYKMLEPLVGKMMAKGILKTQSVKMGFNEENITDKHINALADYIEQGMVVFIGSDAAKQLGEKIRMIK